MTSKQSKPFTSESPPEKPHWLVLVDMLGSWKTTGRRGGSGRRVLRASKPQRDVPKAKMGMKSKRKYRLLGLAPTPGVYEGPPGGLGGGWRANGEGVRDGIPSLIISPDHVEYQTNSFISLRSLPDGSESGGAWL